MLLKQRSDMPPRDAWRDWRDVQPLNATPRNLPSKNTGGWRYIRPIYEDKVPACQNACPTGNDIEGWMRLLKDGEYEKAYWHLKREQPFPRILGRVCFKHCEEACNRGTLDARVAIRELERFVGDCVSPDAPHPDLPPLHGKTMAIVGSGPAGMSAAYFGRLLGFKVTLFEKLPFMGGILRVGIPRYRLPREIVEAEFRGLASMGIQLKPATAIGKDIPLGELRASFDYIFLATGVHGSMKLGLEAEERSTRILSGLAMLKAVALNEHVELGKKVAIIGGGNTAIDAARTAVRMGCDALLIYRRSEHEMPAHAEEVLQAREEGVKFRFLATPEKIELKNDATIHKLILSEMELGPPDESGRRQPVKKRGSFFEMEADSIVTAIGETALFDYAKGIIEVDDRTARVDGNLQCRTRSAGKAKIFAGGDITNEQRTVVHAIAAGKRAAIAMDCDRQGLNTAEVLDRLRMGDGTALSFSMYRGWQSPQDCTRNNRKVVRAEDIVYDYFETAPRIEATIKDAGERTQSFDAYGATYTNEEAHAEAARCMHCGRCTECDNCLIFCPDMSVLVSAKGGAPYETSYDYCKGCGVCAAECPRSAITMVEEEKD